MVPTHPIPSGLLNRMAKLTQNKPASHSKRVNSVYLDQTNTLHKAGLANSIFQQWGNYGNISMKTWTVTRKTNPLLTKEKQTSLSLHRVLMLLLWVHLQDEQQKNPFNTSRIILILYYHIFNNLEKFLNIPHCENKARNPFP